MSWQIQKPDRILILAGVLLEIIFLILWRINDWSSRIPLFLGLFFAAFLIYLVLAVLGISGSFEKGSRLSATILGFAFLFRLTLFWCTPSLSEDIYRYIWDGRVQMAGINPYRYPPQ